MTLHGTEYPYRLLYRICDTNDLTKIAALLKNQHRLTNKDPFLGEPARSWRILAVRTEGPLKEWEDYFYMTEFVFSKIRFKLKIDYPYYDLASNEIINYENDISTEACDFEEIEFLQFYRMGYYSGVSQGISQKQLIDATGWDLS